MARQLQVAGQQGHKGAHKVQLLTVNGCALVAALNGCAFRAVRGMVQDCMSKGVAGFNRWVASQQ